MSSMGQIQNHYEPFDLVTNTKEREEGENRRVNVRGREKEYKSSVNLHLDSRDYLYIKISMCYRTSSSVYHRVPSIY